MAEQMTFRLARSDDRDTSWAATEGGNVEGEIMAAFSRVPEMTDDELAFILKDRYSPTVKTGRSRLTKEGELIDTGWRRDSLRGRPQIVWCKANEPWRCRPVEDTPSL